MLCSLPPVQICLESGFKIPPPTRSVCVFSRLRVGEHFATTLRQTPHRLILSLKKSRSSDSLPALDSEFQPTLEFMRSQLIIIHSTSAQLLFCIQKFPRIHEKQIFVARRRKVTTKFSTTTATRPVMRAGGLTYTWPVTSGPLRVR